MMYTLVGLWFLGSKCILGCYATSTTPNAIKTLPLQPPTKPSQAKYTTNSTYYFRSSSLYTYIHTYIYISDRQRRRIYASRSNISLNPTSVYLSIYIATRLSALISRDSYQPDACTLGDSIRNVDRRLQPASQPVY